jgi:hypothetical protein
MELGSKLMIWNRVIRPIGSTSLSRTIAGVKIARGTQVNRLWFGAGLRAMDGEVDLCGIWDIHALEGGATFVIVCSSTSTAISTPAMKPTNN